MFFRVLKSLWGDLSREEYTRFGLLAATLFFIIGTYWMMKPMKHSLFMRIVGSSYIPYVKLASLVCMMVLVMVYSKLVDWLEKHTLIYLLAALYAIGFLIITGLLLHPVIGINNTSPDKGRLLGWAIYLVIESYGSLIVALFWSFVASIMDTSSAKKGYHIIVFGAQLGAVTGAAIDTQASKLGLPLLMFFSTIGLVIVPIIVRSFMNRGLAHSVHDTEKKVKTGPIEGLRLLVTRPYLMGILIVSTFADIVGTILEYHMDVLSNQFYTTVEQVTEFMALFGLCANLLSMVFALVGTSYFLRRFGLMFCLTAYPFLVAVVVMFTWLSPVLWIFFVAMVAVKAFNYALNNPSKEIMYIPTSRDVKFKTKSWIDSFGARTAKGVGSAVTASVPVLSELIIFGSIFSLGVIGVWIAAAFFVSRTNNNLVESGQIIK